MEYMIAINDFFMVASSRWYQCEWYEWSKVGSIALQLGQAEKGDYVVRPFILQDVKPEGLLADSMFNIIYNQIWLAFRRLEARVIPSDKYWDFWIWNAYFEEENLQEIEAQGALEGVFFTTDIRGVFKPLQMKETLLKVMVEGPPTIKGLFLLLFTQETLSVEVSGLRILALPLANFISRNLTYTLSVPLVVSTSMRLKEQRRALSDVALRRIKGKVFVDTSGTTNLFNLLDKHGGKLFSCAIPFERLTPVADNLIGLTVIYVEEDLTEYTEIDKSPGLLIYFMDTGKSSFYEIESIDKQNRCITIKLPVAENAPKNRIKVFPAFYAVITNVRENVRVGKYTVIELEMQEVII